MRLTTIRSQPSLESDHKNLYDLQKSHFISNFHGRLKLKPMKNQWIRILTISLFTRYFALKACGTLLAQGVTIGNQVWMVKNLDVAKFRNGENIPKASSAHEWLQAAENHRAAWCWYENDSVKGAKYGSLYNWYAVVDIRGLCPAGWHVPTDNDWQLLIKHLDPAADTLDCCKNAAGSKMKELATIYSGKDGYSKNKDAHSSSGFQGLPGGIRDVLGEFDYLNQKGEWWTSTETRFPNAWSRGMDFTMEGVFRGNSTKICGFSVRCLRD